MKGILIFYIDIKKDQDTQKTIDAVLACNKEIIERLNKEAEYVVMAVPVTNEACRIEKVDLDLPYPRFLPRSHADIVELDRRRAERKLKEKQQ